MLPDDILPFERLAVGYLLLLFPLGIMLWYQIPLVGKVLLGAIRMTVQLLFVGFYLQIVFKYNNLWLNAAWLLIMITVADISILRHCELRVRPLMIPLLIILIMLFPF